MIPAGKRDQRITLQAPTFTRAGDGAETIAYNDIATVWASYTASGGKEFWAAQKRNAEVSALFGIQYRSGMDTRWRVKYGNRYLEILFTDDSHRREGDLYLHCKEVT